MAKMQFSYLLAGIAILGTAHGQFAGLPDCGQQCVQLPDACGASNIGCFCNSFKLEALANCCKDDITAQTHMTGFYSNLCKRHWFARDISSSGISSPTVPRTTALLPALSSATPVVTTPVAATSLARSSAGTAIASPSSAATTSSGSSGGASGGTGTTSDGGSSSSDSSTTGSGPSISPGAIAGIVIGAIAAIGILIAAIGLVCYRRKRSRNDNNTYVQHQWPQYPPHQQFGQQPPTGQPQWQHQHQPPMSMAPSGQPVPLNPSNLDQHLASQEWAGIRRDVPQQQSANNYSSTFGKQSDGLSGAGELRPQDAAGESRYGDAMSGVMSNDPRTATYAASESVWPRRV